MAQNKLENQIREKLGSREIQPSAQAWDRLDAMLSVAEEKKTRRLPFLSSRFIGIAASVLVLLAAGMFFFSQNNTGIRPQNNVVGTEVKKALAPKEEGTINSTEAVVSSGNHQPATGNRPSTDTHSSDWHGNQEVSIKNQKTNKQSNNQDQIIRDKEIQFEYSSDVALKNLPKTETGKEIIVNADKGAQSDEQLLARLDNTAKQSANKKSTVKVDARSLLSQVDGEVEYTFREKVINKISKNYKEVKVALANRNNE
jgi:hypothetical protein